MKTITVTSQGQITLPAKVRRALNLKGSDQLQYRFDPEKRQVVLEKPMSLDALTAFTSQFVKGTSTPDDRTRESYEEYVVEKWRSKDL